METFSEASSESALVVFPTQFIVNAQKKQQALRLYCTAAAPRTVAWTFFSLFLNDSDSEGRQEQYTNLWLR